jgi:hypothetical protein
LARRGSTRHGRGAVRGELARPGCARQLHAHRSPLAAGPIGGAAAGPPPPLREARLLPRSRDPSRFVTDGGLGAASAAFQAMCPPGSVSSEGPMRRCPPAARGPQCSAVSECSPSARTSAGQSRYTATSNRCRCFAGAWRSRAGGVPSTIAQLSWTVDQPTVRRPRARLPRTPCRPTGWRRSPVKPRWRESGSCSEGARHGSRADRLRRCQ